MAKASSLRRVWGVLVCLSIPVCRCVWLRPWDLACPGAGRRGDWNPGARHGPIECLKSATRGSHALGMNMHLHILSSNRLST